MYLQLVFSNLFINKTWHLNFEVQVCTHQNVCILPVFLAICRRETFFRSWEQSKNTLLLICTSIMRLKPFYHFATLRLAHFATLWLAHSTPLPNPPRKITTFFFCKINQYMIERCMVDEQTKRKWSRRRNIEISKYFHLISYYKK